MTILYFALHLLILSPPFPSGHTLAEQECLNLNPDTPQTCLKCVNSNEGSSSQNDDDPVGTATTVGGCIKKQAKTFYATMTTLALLEKDKKMKNVHLNCSKNYSDAVRILENSVKQALKDQKYVVAERFVVKALGFEYECYGHITKSVAKVPGDVSENMNKYEELSEATAWLIIERL